MRFNNLETFLAKVKSGETAYGAVANFDNSLITEMIAHCGYDFVWVDMEHAAMTLTDALHHIQALRCTGCAPFIRVPWNVNYLLKPILDLSPAGVIIPMVNTADEAAKAVRSCRYPIHGGERGYATIRNNEFNNIDTPEYMEISKSDPMVIVQIEHREAVENIEKIVQVEGIGSLCIGPYDLSCSYGKPAEFSDPEISAAIDHVRETAFKAGVMVGGYCNNPIWENRFMNWKALGGDADMLNNALRERLKTAREAEAKRKAAAQ